MTTLFVLLSLFAGVGEAAASSRTPADWIEVTEPGFYYLTQNLKINEQVRFPQGTKFSFVEVIGGGGYSPVVSFELRPTICPDSSASADLSLINPTGITGEEINVELRSGCQVFFYVENNLLYRPSLFTSSTE
ncbi:MAG TPA: hypothetical protein VN132_14575 [Bdellovibrio sp.]|nr:hypothetical protein [Bdellovibrio sp.]